MFALVPLIYGAFVDVKMRPSDICVSLGISVKTLLIAYANSIVFTLKL